MQMNRCVNCMGEIGGYPCPHCGFDPAKEAQLSFALPWNTILHGKFLVGRMLGQGGFGITYVGWDLSLDVKVAIKEFYPAGQVSRQSTQSHKLVWNSTAQSVEMQSSGLESFLKEARKMARVDRLPQVVRVRETFHENGTAYIIMDFVDGETLKARLEREGPLSFDRAMEIFRPTIAAMEKVHKAGLVHRDLSPDNIMLEPEGGVRILDLGAAKDLAVNRGDSSMLVTKGGFSPVEQYGQRGGSGPWTDVYAMAATIYYTLTGIRPPNAIDRLDDDELQWDLPALQSMDAPARDALQKALAVSAKKRTQSMAELLAGLEQTGPTPEQNPDQPKQASQPEPAPPPELQPKPEPQPKPAAPPKKKFAFGLILCIAVLVFAVWKFQSGTAGPKVTSQEETYVTDRAYDSGTYTGDWKNGKPNGQGTLTWANGDKYAGDFVDGKRTGRGTYYFSSGKYEEYEGDYVDGLWNGQGTLYYANGNKYEGNFADGKLNGQGTYTWANGEKYEGNFVDDKLNGQGIYTWANGDKYTGNFVDSKMNGWGTFTRSNGDKYKGYFVDDKMTGQGTYTWLNGDKYVGDFVDDEMTGRGTLTLANGEKYVGTFANGEITGWGTYYNADGSVKVGGTFTWPNREPGRTETNM